MSSSTGAVLSQRDGAIATVILHHPGKRNALSAAMWQALAALMGELDADESLRCIVIRGAGGHFAAGADISEFAALRSTREQAERYHEAYVAGALSALAACRHPLLALIEGNCVGGGLEIACCCDLRIAGDSALLGIPIARLGFNLAPQEFAALLALAGVGTTMELLLEGRLLKAQEALQKGLLTRVLADAEVEAEAYATARRIAAGAPLSARMHKRLLRAQGRPDSDTYQASYDWVDSTDYREGIAAFLSKRPPQFTGK